MTISRFTAPLALGPSATNRSARVTLGGTTTPATLYTDATGLTEAPNPIRVPASGTIDLFAEGGNYDVTTEVAGYATTFAITVEGTGLAVVRSLPFSFDTPDLATGAALYTPTPGDIWLDAWMSITEAFDGTTPTGDLGTSFPGNAGLYSATGASVDMTAADDYAANIVRDGTARANGTIAVLGPVTNGLILPRPFTDATPVQVVVSQDGTPTGGATDATTGAGILHIITVTPA